MDKKVDDTLRAIKLGENQASVLRCLLDHKGYRDRGGWLWDTRSNTSRIILSLAKHGLAIVEMKAGPYTKSIVETATISPYGRRWLKVNAS